MTVSTAVLDSAVFDAAAELIRERWTRRPVAGLVLGSGFGGLASAIDVESVFAASDIPGLPSSTATGHRGRIVCGTLGGLPVIVQDGRLHSYEGHDFATVAWPVSLMIRLGIEALIVTNASGGVNPEFVPGDVMLIDDHINLMWGNPLIGLNDERIGPRFPDMCDPYDAGLGERFAVAAVESGQRIHRGVYLALAGPNYETAAEYRMVRTLGADVVGMSTVPEVLVARHAGIRVLGISIVSNVFQDTTVEAGEVPDETTGEAVVAQVAETAPRVGNWIQQVIANEWGSAGQVENGSSDIVLTSPAGSDGSADRTAASVALLTAAGRGAVAVIRVAGDLSAVSDAVNQYFEAANGRSIEHQNENALCYGVWRDSESSGASVVEAEEVVVCRTDVTSVEIHCHGGPAAIERILCQLEEVGIQRVGWCEQLLEPVADDAVCENGVSTSLDVECLEAVARATTERAALILLRQADGLLRSEVCALCRAADQVSSAIPGAEDEQKVCIGRGEVVTRLRSLVSRAEFGVHLAEPWLVVLAGRPNVGKSTLLNVLLGYSRAIVFDEPGTTRDVVTGETAFDGWPFLISDTAGVRETGSELEQEGIRRTQQSIGEADLVCLLLDASVPPTQEDQRLLADVRATVVAEKLLIVAHKADCPRAWGDEMPDGTLPVSSVTQEGVDQLVAAIVERLVGDVPDREDAVPVTRRQAGCLHEALAAAEQGDWSRAAEQLMECRDGYRPDGADS